MQTSNSKKKNHIPINLLLIVLISQNPWTCRYCNCWMGISQLGPEKGNISEEFALNAVKGGPKFSFIRKTKILCNWHEYISPCAVSSLHNLDTVYEQKCRSKPNITKGIFAMEVKWTIFFLWHKHLHTHTHKHTFVEESLRGVVANVPH